MIRAPPMGEEKQISLQAVLAGVLAVLASSAFTTSMLARKTPHASNSSRISPCTYFMIQNNVLD
eukprot:1158530-Pelagomonas_calceolata.AAC.7